MNISDNVNIRNTNRYTYEDNYALLHINSPTHGKFKIKLDIEDVDKCKKYVWSIQRRITKRWNKIYFYVVNAKTGMQTRYILDFKDKSKVVDHINGDTLDNRKENLQICTNAENIRKARIRSDNTSGETGVCWDKANNKWIAYIYIDCKYKHLGYYNSKEEATKIRRNTEKIYFGDFIPIEG